MIAMHSYDLLLPDPDLVERVRQGLHAHNARTAVRDRLLRQALAPEAAEPAPHHARGFARLTLVPASHEA
jgi:hypothetical protein